MHTLIYEVYLLVTYLRYTILLGILSDSWDSQTPARVTAVCHDVLWSSDCWRSSPVGYDGEHVTHGFFKELVLMRQQDAHRTSHLLEQWESADGANEFPHLRHLLPTPKKSEWVFTKPNGRPYTAVRVFRAAGQEARLIAVYVHRTFATRLVENGVRLVDFEMLEH